MIIRFRKSIYPSKAIKKAVRDYSHLANFNLNQNKNYFLVRAENIQSGLESAFQDEFSNYVLSLIKND